MNVWPQPGQPRRTPWEPPEPSPSPPSTPQGHLLDAGRDWLAERLLDQRMVSLTGRLDTEQVNRAASSLMLLDASGDDPVELRLSEVDADLDTTLTLVDTLELMGVPVHATCLGQLSGPVVGVLAVADHRAAGAHTSILLREPSARIEGQATDVATNAEQHPARLHRLQERIAEGCRRSVDEVAADMRAGRYLTAEEAREYGLIDTVRPAHAS